MHHRIKLDKSCQWHSKNYCIMEHKGLRCKSLHVYFPQTSKFLESLATTSINMCWRELFNGVPHVPQIRKFAEIYQKWQPIQLVSSLTSSASKEVIKSVHSKSMTFWLFLEHWCCHLLVEGAVVNFSDWGLLLFYVVATIEHDLHLFDFVVVITIKRGDQGHSCKENDICSSVLSSDVVICLWKVQWWIFLVEGDCCLFDVVATIDAYVMGTFMPHASMTSTQRAWNVLLLSWVLMLLCTCKSCCTEFFLLSTNIICLMLLLSLPSNEVINGIHALLIVVILNHPYFSLNSIHTCYTP